MNGFDTAILHLLNGFAGRSWRFDNWVVWLSNDAFQKGGIMILLFWWVWFRPGENAKTNRETLVCLSAAAPLALALSRLIGYLVPFRARPLKSSVLPSKRTRWF